MSELIVYLFHTTYVPYVCVLIYRKNIDEYSIQSIPLNYIYKKDSSLYSSSLLSVSY